MKPAQARDLAPALTSLGILSVAHEGKIEPGLKGYRSTHGTGGIEGRWAHSDRRASIGCAHVAQALVDAERWTAEAIRACEHRFNVRAKPTRRAPRRTHCAGCRCEERKAA